MFRFSIFFIKKEKHSLQIEEKKEGKNPAKKREFIENNNNNDKNNDNDQKSTLTKVDVPNTFKNPLNFKRGELIATGAYGKVYKCLDLTNGRLLAVKNVKVFDKNSFFI